MGTKLLIGPSPAELAALARTALNAPRPAASQLLTLWLSLPVELEAPGGRLKIRSSLEASLGDCRSVTNRDSNGNVCPGAHAGMWLGAIGYLALLDQIGGAVVNVRAGRQPSYNSGVERALAHFTSVTDDDAVCIYALRNSLAHDFRLVNLPPSKVGAARRKKLTQLFTLTQGSSSLITRPKRAWTPRQPNCGEATIVDVRLLGDLVEQTVREVRRVHEAGNLRLRRDAPRGMAPITPAVWRKGRFFAHSA